MAEYITKEQVIDWYRTYGHAGEHIPFEILVSDLRDMKSADVAPVVRCGDCKYHYWEQEPCHGKTVHYCELPHMRGVEIFKEFFCYYGERKEGDSNG